MANEFLAWLFLGILGAILGSFCASFASRICEKKPLLKGRSFCFSCERKLTILELVPIFSYLFLKGRCKICGVKIPFLAFLSEILGIFLMYIAFFYTQNLKNFVFFAIFLFVCLSLSLIDLKLKAVPSILLWFAFFCAFLVGVDLDYIIDSTAYFFFDAAVFAGFVFLLKSFVFFLKNFKSQEVEENLGDADIILLTAICGIFGFFDTLIVFFLAAFLSLPFFYFALKRGQKELAFLPFISFAMLIICVYLSFGRHL